MSKRDLAVGEHPECVPETSKRPKSRHEFEATLSSEDAGDKEKASRDEGYINSWLDAQETKSPTVQKFRDILTHDQCNMDKLLLCIQWVLFARQPLKPEQLHHAILAGVNPEALSARNPSDIQTFILNSSNGLVKVTKSNNKFVVEFINESVRKFLLKKDVLKEVWSDLATNFQGESHERLKQCCLTYTNTAATHPNYQDLPLEMQAAEDRQNLRRSVDGDYPFLEYAVTNVLYHANAAQAKDIDQRGFLRSFPPSHWVKLDNLFKKNKSHQHKQTVSLLYILAEKNAGDLIGVHPSRLTCFAVEDECFGAPFLAALATGSKEAARAFLGVLAADVQPPTSPFHTLYEQYVQGEIKPFQFTRKFRFSQTKGLLHCLDRVDELTVLAFLASIQDQVDGFVFKNGPTPLLWAAREGKQAAVDQLLEMGAEVDPEDQNGRTPLSWAAERGHEAIVSGLLGRGADSNSRDNCDWTPLMQAAAKGHDAVVDDLLGHGADFDAQNSNGKTPLSLAACGDHEAIVEQLLAQGADINLGDEEGRTPLSWAASEGYTAIARMLLDGHAGINLRDQKGWTPLSYAADMGDDGMVVLLLQYEADVNFKDREGCTPLSHAAVRGHGAVIATLLQHGAHINSQDETGRTPLSHAAHRYREDIIEILLDGRADIDSQDSEGRTPLSWAVHMGHEAVVKVLLARRANIESEDLEGCTPLLWAVFKGQLQIAELLLLQGSNPDVRESKGRSPLSWAAEHGSEAFVKLLLKFKGVDINSTDTRYGRAPLSWAAMNGHKSIVGLLLRAGADRNLQDRGGRTALARATERGHHDVVNLLQSTGGEMPAPRPESWTSSVSVRLRGP